MGVAAEGSAETRGGGAEEARRMAQIIVAGGQGTGVLVKRDSLNGTMLI